MEVGGFRAQRPQPGNALQEGRDASEKREGLGNGPGAQISVLLFFFFSSSSSSLLLRVLARGPVPHSGPRPCSASWPAALLGFLTRGPREGNIPTFAALRALES